jgi:hypothetical protein
MPFAAVPYEARELEAVLTARFNIITIPTVIVIDSHGNVLTSHGRCFRAIS